MNADIVEVIKYLVIAVIVMTFLARMPFEALMTSPPTACEAQRNQAQ